MGPHPEKRRCLKVLREARQKDSRDKRARVLSVIDQLLADDEPVAFTRFARAANVSHWLVYADGVREHIEAARRRQERAAASSARTDAREPTGWRLEKELLRQDNRRLREEAERLNGTVFHDRTAQKIRRQEQGHEYATAQLIALGAPRPRPGCDRARWLSEALAAVGARNVRHRGAHRWVFQLGRSRREREDVRLVVPSLKPYPKLPDLEHTAA
ncbi:DUF6262 family protein [Streptomyces geysiriensis]|uniref:DUF6262 family protein n=1 Tax=Streptomyces geysiriensis TaxID=68207 RepID=UPI002176D1AD|nr:DUF6262 family protein [Streptomyces geysiriensis]